MVGDGFKRGVGAPVVFHNPRTGVRLVVHGDDFTFSGTRRELEVIRERMKEWYEVKDRGIMGSGGDEIKEVEILGRRIRWTREGIEYEGDGSHRRALMEEMGLGQDSNAVGCPAERPEGRPSGDDEVELREAERRGFRSMAAKLNYIGQDRSDVQYAARGVCSGMAKPSVGDMRRLRGRVRYLARVEGVTWEYGEWRDGEEVRVDVYVDSDWAKEASRKSTSGGMLAVGGAGV